jgi:hypothetical protein
MTVQAIADKFNARRAGRGRFMARCPAHDDSSPSLSIREGRNGRVLVRCFAGCALDTVLDAAGLRMANLFAGPPPSPEQRRTAQQLRAEKEVQESRQRRRRIALMKGYRACDRRMDEIAVLLLADTPQDAEALAQEFHEALEFQRCVEMEVFG